MLFTYMTGSERVPGANGLGDPDFVVVVPPEQYLDRYVFFTDPTYPETNLVVVRKRDGAGVFHDVTPRLRRGARRLADGRQRLRTSRASI